jgi:hypothetical protein
MIETSTVTEVEQLRQRSNGLENHEVTESAEQELMEINSHLEQTGALGSGDGQ